MKTHSEIIIEIVNKYKKDPLVRAIFLSGSVARGYTPPYANLDISIVVKGEKKWFKVYREGEISVEIVFGPLRYFRQSLDKKPWKIYSTLEKKALWDPENLLEDLKKLAKKKLADYKVPEEKLDELRYWLHSFQNRIKSALSDGNLLIASFQSANVLWKIIEGYFALSNTPTPGAGKVVGLLKDLKVKPKDFEKLFERACVGNPEERCEAVLSLIDFLMKKSGGGIKDLETQPTKI